MDEQSFTVTWKTRWVEEHARLERMAECFERSHRHAQNDCLRKSVAFERLAGFANDLSKAWQSRRQFEAWRHWVLAEKGSRQFERVADELASRQKAHEHDKVEAMRALDADEAYRLNLEETLKRRRAQQAACRAGLVQMCQLASEREMRRLAWVAWRMLTHHDGTVQTLLGQASERVMSSLAIRTLVVWQTEACRSRRQRLQQGTRGEEESLPKVMRRSASESACRTLSWLQAAEDARLLGALLTLLLACWRDHVRSHACWRRGVITLLGGHLHGVHNAALLLGCVSAWFQIVDATKTGKVVALAQDEHHKELAKHFEVRSAAIMAINRAESTSIAHRYFSCWKWSFVWSRTHCASEQIRREHELTLAAYRVADVELNAKRAEANAEIDAQLLKQAALESRVQNIREATFSVHTLVELQGEELASMESACASAWSRGGDIEYEFADARESAKLAERSVKDLADVREALRADVSAEVSAFEQRSRDMEEAVAEAASEREGRVTDLRVIKSQAKAESSRYDAISRELIDSRTEDQAACAAQLAVYEGRRRRLEKELRPLRPKLVPAQHRSTELEVSRQRLGERLVNAQAKLKTLQSRKIDEEIQALVLRNGETQRRCEELERDVKFVQLESSFGASSTPCDVSFFAEVDSGLFSQPLSPRSPRATNMSPRSPKAIDISTPARGGESGADSSFGTTSAPYDANPSKSDIESGHVSSMESRRLGVRLRSGGDDADAHQAEICAQLDDVQRAVRAPRWLTSSEEPPMAAALSQSSSGSLNWMSPSFSAPVSHYTNGTGGRGRGNTSERQGSKDSKGSAGSQGSKGTRLTLELQRRLNSLTGASATSGRHLIKS